MTGYEFPGDVIRSLEMALMKTFSSPKVSTYCTAKGSSEGRDRSDMMAQPCLWRNLCRMGYDGERGRQAIADINTIQSFYQIENDEYIFVLSTFVLLPIQWVDTYGWRKTTYNERQALFYFLRLLEKE